MASHDNGNGLLEWKDESQGERKEVDLRGANLKDVDLSFLPLAKLIGGLMREDEEWPEANMEEQITRSQREMAAVQLQGAKLLCAQLQNAILVGAQMQGANLAGADLQGACLTCAQLGGTFLIVADLQGACLFRADLSGANLGRANLRETMLWDAQLQNADLRGVHLQGTNLTKANLQGANLTDVTLADKNGIGPQLVDAQWGTANLAVVDWSQMAEIGEECLARKYRSSHGKIKDMNIKLFMYKRSVRANRQLVVVLREQGLNEEADYFAYHAQKLQCVVWRIQKNLGNISS